MWTNGAARRGRRMSFEMPVNFPQNSQFLHGRPEMFHPFVTNAASQQTVSIFAVVVAMKSF